MFKAKTGKCQTMHSCWEIFSHRRSNKDKNRRVFLFNATESFFNSTFTREAFHFCVCESDWSMCVGGWQHINLCRHCAVKSMHEQNALLCRTEGSISGAWETFFFLCHQEWVMEDRLPSVCALCSLTVFTGCFWLLPLVFVTLNNFKHTHTPTHTNLFSIHMVAE